MSASHILGRISSWLPLRRKDRRAPVVVTVDWRRFGSQMHSVSTTLDVSRGGAFVLTADPRPVGTPIVLALKAPGGTLERHARVAWKNPRGMGLRFTRTLPL